MTVRPRTLLEKLWDEHLVRHTPGEPDLLYVDLHLVQDASSPLAFEALRDTGRTVRRPDLTVATEDHNTPTDYPSPPPGSPSTAAPVFVADQVSRRQVRALRDNCAHFGITLYPMGDDNQGIVHVIGPEQGLTLPGMTIVCGDSHTSTHGAFGALALGVGTSEVAHVLATQTIRMDRPRTMSVTVDGDLAPGVTPKDLALALIAKVGTGGGTGHLVEYRGEAVTRMSMEGRMTVCNMSIEWGARAGVVAPDETTLAYLAGRPNTPRGRQWADAAAYWRTLRTDEGAAFDASTVLAADEVTPFVSWGTNPSQSAPLSGHVPDPAELDDAAQRRGAAQALEYMGLTPGTPLRDIQVDTVFLGSCTNGRIEDLRAAAAVLRGRTVAAGLRLLVVPGSTAVRRQAEAEGLDRVFREAGGDWRQAGCSMCLGMNPDRLAPGQRCVSTANRNFPGRQGTRSRTHLASPEVAAATAVTGRLRGPADL